jgi:hypothetical protein
MVAIIALVEKDTMDLDAGVMMKTSATLERVIVT